MIRLEDYLRRIESIQVQYNYAREAIMGFIVSQDPAKAPKSKTAEKMIPLSEFLDCSDDEFLSRIGTYVDSLKGGFPEDKKDLENRLAQNEIILLVAIFEDQMKSIHREMLRQNPKLLSPDPKVELGRLVALGETAIIEEEIERTVRALDYKSVEVRAKAFEKLGLPWNVKSEEIERMLRLRNEILHEDTDKEVTGWDLTEVRNLVVSLPACLFMLGTRQYPNVFEVLPEMIDFMNRRAAEREQSQSSE
jgi:hypothetical protein